MSRKVSGMSEVYRQHEVIISDKNTNNLTHPTATDFRLSRSGQFMFMDIDTCRGIKT